MTGQTDFAIGISLADGATMHYYPIHIPSKIKRVYTGYRNYAAVDANNVVWVCGINSNGELGIGNTTIVTTPVPVYYGTNPKIYFRPYGSNSMFIVDNGNIYATGYNNYGFLGIGNVTQQTTLQTILKINGANWKDLMHSGIQTFAWTDDTSGNKLYACGDNSVGQLGIGSTTSPQTSLVPCINLNGTQITNVNKVVINTPGPSHNISVYVLLNNGDLYVTGDNWLYGTGIIGTSVSNINRTFMGPIAYNIIDITGSGTTSVIILRRDGLVFTSGNPSIFAPYEMGAASYGFSKALYRGEHIYIDKIFGNTFSNASLQAIVNKDGSVFISGYANLYDNCCGISPKTQLYMMYELTEKKTIDIRYLNYSNTNTTVLLKKVNGSISACGHNYFTGEVHASTSFFKLTLPSE